MTLCQRSPSGFTDWRSRIDRAIGTWTEATVPTADDISVRPDIAACTAAWARRRQKDRVGRARRDAADDVAGVDVLHAGIRNSALEVVGDRIAQVGSDVLQFRVARSVLLRRIAVQKFLARSLGHDNHRVFSLVQPLVQHVEQALLALQLKKGTSGMSTKFASLIANDA